MTTLMLTTDTHKVCSQCYEVKPRNEFYNSKTTKDGKRCYCIICENGRQKYRKKIIKTRTRTHKPCSWCKQIKPIDDFFVDRLKKITRARTECKQCLNGYNKSRRNFIKRFRDIPDNKTCKTCQINKPANEFNVNNNTVDRLHYQCKDCNHQYMKEYRLLNQPTKICRLCKTKTKRCNFPKKDNTIRNHNWNNRLHICRKCFKEYKVNEGDIDTLIDKIQERQIQEETEPQKSCNKCNQVKGISQFHNDRKACTECQRKYRRERYHITKKRNA